MNNKKVLALSLALTIATMPALAGAKELDKKDIDKNVVVTTQVDDSHRNYEDEGQYITYSAVIKEVNKSSFLLEDVNKKGNQLIVNIDKDTILVDGHNVKAIKFAEFKVGDKVEVFYPTVTPMALSYPGQVSPEVIVRRGPQAADKVLDNYKVDLFNNELVSSDNQLAINLPEEADKIVDVKGKKVDVSELRGAKLLVFYGATTRSIPAQTTPYKIVVLETLKDMEVSNYEVVNIQGRTVELEGKIYKNKDGVTMIPLRQITEELGYEVEWNQKDFSTELTRGAEWTRVKIGENNYNFAKMAFELEAAPELKDGKTYVPVSFLTEALALETVNISANGTLYLR